MKVLLRYVYISLIVTFLPYSALNAGHCPHCSNLRDDCLEMRTHGKGSSGKWLDKETPKRGWTCKGAEDLGVGVTKECEMCEREQVRYIHHMIHGDQLPLEMSVGCICSGHMEGSLDDPQLLAKAVLAAKRRTQNLQSRATRRVKFPDLAGWKVSKKGNDFLNKDEHHIIIIAGQYGKFSAIVDSQKLGQWVDTKDLAKLAAFDFLYPSLIQ